MMPMTPRERIQAALNHRDPDHVPLDIGGSSVTTMVDKAYDLLRAHFSIDAEIQYLSRRSRLAILDEMTASRLGADTRAVFLGAPDDRPDVYHPDGLLGDEWQVVWRAAGGHYIPVGCPLVNATEPDLYRFSWPDPYDPGRTRGLHERARQLHEETDYAVVLSLPAGVIHQSQYLRGFEQFLIDLMVNKAFAAKLMDHVLEVYLHIVDNALESAGDHVDVVTFGDDLAFQDRLMVRPSIYRQLIKPRHKRLVDFIRRKTDAAVLYHSCGAVYELIPDFIEIGIDALNPIQVSACDMSETDRLKREFGADICFWGGIDTHYVLPRGTPDDVRREVRRRITDLAPGGGYVLAAVHNIQEDVPVQNLLAMVEAAQESG